MSRTIFFRVGNKDDISLGDFVDSLKNFLGILRDLDATLSQDKQGSMEWRIAVLRKESPPIVGVTYVHKRLELPDVGGHVEAQILDNARSLARGTDRTEYLSDHALSHMKRIAAKTLRIGPSSVYTQEREGQKREELITETTLGNVSQLTDPRYSAYGSIIGKLEAISVHKANEFRVWDRKTLRPVKCKFAEAQEERVKDLLRHTVTVSGLIRSNSSGMPISIDLEGLDEYNQRGPLPSINEMCGSIKDFTGGKTLREYLEDIAND